MLIVLAANPEAPHQPWVADAAADLARQTGGTVAVVAVDEIELERLAPLPRSVYLERATEAADAAASRLTDAGVEATTTVLSGRPLEQILQFAADQAADLIVVGSSSRPPVAQRLLGSLPMSLIRKSPRPVLVVTHPATTS